MSPSPPLAAHSSCKPLLRRNAKFLVRQQSSNGFMHAERVAGGLGGIGIVAPQENGAIFSALEFAHGLLVHRGVSRYTSISRMPNRSVSKVENKPTDCAAKNRCGLHVRDKPQHSPAQFR